MLSLEEFKHALAAPELREPRRVVCRTLATQLAACGERWWAFGFGPRDFRTACSMVIQFGGCAMPHSSKTLSEILRKRLEFEQEVASDIQDSATGDRRGI